MTIDEFTDLLDVIAYQITLDQVEAANRLTSAFEKLTLQCQEMVEAISSDSPIRLAQCGDLVAAAEYEKRLADAAGIKA